MNVMGYCPQCNKSLSFSDNFICSCGYTIELEKELYSCPFCKKKDFYKQKDFNPLIGRIIFIIAAILSIFTYGLSFIVFYIIDFFLYKKIPFLVLCYHCGSHFRDVKRIKDIKEFDHYKSDMIKYNQDV
jgi:hypothetical protein